MCSPSSARRRGVADGRGGALTAIQRFGSAANPNVHFHSLVVQGVFAGESARFVPLPAPTDHDAALISGLAHVADLEAEDES